MSTESLYPLKLQAVYKEKIWGGRNLARLLGKNLPPKVKVGESWEVADDSVVVNGPLGGRRLAELAEAFRVPLLGTLAAADPHSSFPLLIKFIDAQDRLSVQVHPDDDYARRLEGVPFGKTEMWYVLDAAPGAEIIHGIQSDHLTAEELAELAFNGGLLPHLHKVSVKAGEVVFIPAGTVHAMGEGLVVCEVQQNCDLTYRLYDWDRLTPEGQPRELHVEKAVAVSRGGPHEHKIPSIVLQQHFGQRTLLAACRYFAVEIWEMTDVADCGADGRTFVAITSLAGNGEISWRKSSISVRSGESVVIPATLGEYQLRPDGYWLVMLAKMPELSRDVVQPLVAAGVERSRILRLGGDLETNDLVDLLQ